MSHWFGIQTLRKPWQIMCWSATFCHPKQVYILVTLHASLDPWLSGRIPLFSNKEHARTSTWRPQTRVNSSLQETVHPFITNENTTNLLELAPLPTLPVSTQIISGILLINHGSPNGNITDSFSVNIPLPFYRENVISAIDISIHKSGALISSIGMYNSGVKLKISCLVEGRGFFSFVCALEWRV